MSVASSTAQAFTSAALTSSIAQQRTEQGSTVPVAKSPATEPAAFFADSAPEVKALMYSNATAAGGMQYMDGVSPYPLAPDQGGLSASYVKPASDGRLVIYNPENGNVGDVVANKFKAVNDANDAVRPQRPITPTPQPQPLRPITPTPQTNKDESALSASDYATIIEASNNAAGKAYGTSKLLPAGALQTDRATAIMSARDLENAQKLIKSPTAKSLVAMTKYADAYGGIAKKVPLAGDVVTAVEEYDRLQKASNLEERQNVVKAAAVNYGGDKAFTTGGAWGGAKAGAIAGTYLYPGIGTIVGGVVGGVGGAFFMHSVYDDNIAPEVRQNLAGEKFKE